ncbi:MAG: glycosyltransferase family 39 protein [Ginsengibacter sp.]
MTFIKKYHYVLFFSAWTLINFFQAANTVLLNDEAYYWVYSNFLDWGYFDHPPMIAALIKAGYFLFKNEFGVRFFIVILNTLTLLIIYNLLNRKNDILFYAIACSIALIQLGGFIAAPDIPLAFFVALFFLVYKKFLVSFSWMQSIFLGIVMALLLYSKYHGVLIIVCTIISNPALLKNKKAYVAVLIGVLLFIPHLLWQYQHGFPSIQYHLFERSESYKISYTIEYIFGQLLLAGPFMGWLFFIGAFKYRAKNLMERALMFSLIGIYCFFFISTFKGRVEANWTVPAIIPLIILSHQYFIDDKKWQRILFFTVPFSLVIIFFIRFYLISENKFISIINTNEFEQNKTWAKQINNVSKGLPVAFINSYQKASKYWFYSGIPSFSLNTPGYRRNNYNYWPVESSMQAKPVYTISTENPLYFMDSIKTSSGILRGKYIDSFYSHSSVQLKADRAISLDKKRYAFLTLNMPGKSTSNLDTISQLQLYIYKDNQFSGLYDLLPVNTDIKEEKIFITSMPVLLLTGEYSARIAITSALAGYPSLNSTIIKMVIP